MPCPLAKEYNCSKTITTKHGAQGHATTHTGLKIPCPLAKEYNCSKTFTTKYYAQRHALIHTRTPTEEVTLRLQHMQELRELRDKPPSAPCPLAKEFNCGKFFFTQGAANVHAKEHLQRQVCTVPMCQAAISGATLANSSMHAHMMVHKLRGQLKLLGTYPHPLVVNVSGSNKLTQEDESIEDAILEDYLANDGKVVDDVVKSAIIDNDMIEASVTDEYFSPDKLFCDSHRKNIRQANDSFKGMSL